MLRSLVGFRASTRQVIRVGSARQLVRTQHTFVVAPGVSIRRTFATGVEEHSSGTDESASKTELHRQEPKLKPKGKDLVPEQTLPKTPAERHAHLARLLTSRDNFSYAQVFKLVHLVSNQPLPADAAVDFVTWSYEHVERSRGSFLLIQSWLKQNLMRIITDESVLQGYNTEAGRRAKVKAAATILNMRLQLGPLAVGAMEAVEAEAVISAETKRLVESRGQKELTAEDISEMMLVGSTLTHQMRSNRFRLPQNMTMELYRNYMNMCREVKATQIRDIRHQLLSVSMPLLRMPHLQIYADLDSKTLGKVMSTHGKLADLIALEAIYGGKMPSEDHHMIVNAVRHYATHPNMERDRAIVVLKALLGSTRFENYVPLVEDLMEFIIQRTRSQTKDTDTFSKFQMTLLLDVLKRMETKIFGTMPLDAVLFKSLDTFYTKVETALPLLWRKEAFDFSVDAESTNETMEQRAEGTDQATASTDSELVDLRTANIVRALAMARDVRGSHMSAEGVTELIDRVKRAQNWSIEAVIDTTDAITRSVERMAVDDENVAKKFDLMGLVHEMEQRVISEHDDNKATLRGPVLSRAVGIYQRLYVTPSDAMEEYLEHCLSETGRMENLKIEILGQFGHYLHWVHKQGRVLNPGVAAETLESKLAQYAASGKGHNPAFLYEAAKAAAALRDLQVTDGWKSSVDTLLDNCSIGNRMTSLRWMVLLDDCGALDAKNLSALLRDETRTWGVVESPEEVARVEKTLAKTLSFDITPEIQSAVTDVQRWLKSVLSTA
eukprot:Clim_evm68s77 gene=Clim_evmTU68s77